jgi:hypothetical protein
MNEEYGHIPDGFLLNPEEIQELRKQKYEIAEYAKEKLRKLMNDNPTHEEMLEIAAERERPFYRYFAIDYCATGEGRSFWLKICRNYQPIDDKDRALEKFEKFVGHGAHYYMHGLEQPTEDEFLEKYGKLVPDYIVEMIARRDQPFFTWETHLHYNYS